MRLTYDQQEPLWDARRGLVRRGGTPFAECVRRIHRALPTSAHASALVDAVLELLGDDGRVDPYTDGNQAIARRADPRGWWLRRPVATFCDGASYHEIDVASEVPLGARPADPAPEADPVPDLLPDDLGRATLTSWAGDAVFELRYGDDGLVRADQTLCRFGDRWSERRFAERFPPTVDPAARPPQAPPPPWFVDFPAEPVSAEAFARMLVAVDPALDPVRVRMNVDAPGGVEGRWWQARQMLRKLALLEKLPTTGGILVIDAFEHPAEDSCVALGPDLARAEAAWLVELARVAPRPVLRGPMPEPEPLPESEPLDEETTGPDGEKRRTISTGWKRITVQPVRAIPWPIPGPRTTPAVALRFPALPSEIPAAWKAEGFTRWRYLVGDSGHVGTALVRDESDGFTQVGDGLLDVVDPRGLEAALDAATAAEEPFPFPEPPWLRYPYEHLNYAAWSDLRQGPIPIRAAGSSWNEEWNWGDMEGDVFRWRICRMRFRD